MLRERTWWLFEAWVLLPLPVALVALLATPLPRAARRRLLWLVERVRCCWAAARLQSL